MRWFGDCINGCTVLRGGFLGVGGNGPDKQKESAAQSSLTNVFNYGLAAGQPQQQTGQQDLASAKADLNQSAGYWQRLLSGGRTDTATLSAPAINSTLAASDATKRSADQFGSGRSGGDVAQKREAQTQADSQVNDIINRNLVGGRTTGAAGLESVAGQKTAIADTNLRNALALLGLGTGAESSVLNSAQSDRANVMAAQAQIWGDVIKGVL